MQTKLLHCVLLALLAIGAGKEGFAAQRAVIGAPGPGRLGNAEQAKFDALMVAHRTVRMRLARDERGDLDRIAARVRDAVFPDGAPPSRDVWGTAQSTVRAAVPGLSESETGTIAAYSVDAIAAGDLDILAYAKTNPEFYALQGFTLQYMQLQSQMQNENRSYTAVSNILKTKHDTVKNSIGNVR